MFQSIVEAVFHYASVQPDKLCLADDKGRVTYKEYADKISRMASAFAADGFEKGDMVVIEASQTINYLAIELALQSLGAIFVPVENRCAAEKIQSFVERTKAKAVIVAKADYEYKDCIVYTYDSFNEKADACTPMVIEKMPTENDISEILFSTGTTGKEKGIVIRHGNNVALAENVRHGVEMEEDNVEMIPSPLNHSHGLRRYYANMYNGSTVVLLGSVMDIMRFFRNIDEYGVNSMNLVPSALTVVLKLSKDKLAEYKDRIRYIQLGSAPLREDDQNKICELLPNTRLYNFYGSTESGCTCIYNFNRKDTKAHCIGKPTFSTTLITVDDDRNPFVSSAEKTGLIATAGGMNMVGYWEDEEETAKVLIDGIVYSNDIGYVDEDGEVILLGRVGDVINVAGNKVSPDEIENVAKLMTEINDCGCIPVADAAKGNVPKLFVEIASGAEFDPKAIRAFLAGKLEPYKVPQFIVEIEKIPRSYNGKLLRKELKLL